MTLRLRPASIALCPTMLHASECLSKCSKGLWLFTTNLEFELRVCTILLHLLSRYDHITDTSKRGIGIV